MENETVQGLTKGSHSVLCFMLCFMFYVLDVCDWMEKCIIIIFVLLCFWVMYMGVMLM